MHSPASMNDVYRTKVNFWYMESLVLCFLMAKLSLVAVRLLKIHEKKTENVIEIGIEASRAISLLLSIPVMMDKLVNREKKRCKVVRM